MKVEIPGVGSYRDITISVEDIHNTLYSDCVKVSMKRGDSVSSIETYVRIEDLKRLGKSL